jgi:hypothetical protein
MKDLEKKKAIELRKEGFSTNYIAKALGVSKSSAFYWTQSVELTSEQKAKLYKHKNANWKWGCDAWVKKCQDRRQSYQLVGKQEVNRGGWEHAAGCMLWWAEGDKSKNQLALTNCDEDMLKFFVEFLKKHYAVPTNKFCIRIQYHEGQDEAELVGYWKSVLGLLDAKVYKSYCKAKKSSVTKWKNGVCRVLVNDTELVNRIWGSVQEYVGFSRPIFDFQEKSS